MNLKDSATLDGYKRRVSALDLEAAKWTNVWRDIRDYILPVRGSFDDNANLHKQIDHQTILSSWPADAAEKMAAGLCSGLTSPSRPWFKLSLTDTDLLEYGPVKEYLDAVENVLVDIMARSNIYSALNSTYLETGGFGTNALLIVQDFQDVIRAHTGTIGEYRLGCGPDGRVNTFSRTIMMTAAQIVAEFGKENVSAQVLTANSNDNTKDTWFKVRHLIQPNPDAETGNPMTAKMPFVSCYWLDNQNDGQFLRRSGFRTFPVMAPRWDRIKSSDIYGIGPGWKALGDVKSLYKVEFDKLVMVDKIVDPPLQVDSNVQDEDVNPMPGGITRTSTLSKDGGLRPVYQINPDLGAVQAVVTNYEQKVGRSFFYDLFNAVTQLGDSGDPKTAYELAKRWEEKLQMLGPVLDNLKSELHDPMIHRIFEIASSIPGLLPPPPPEIQGHDIQITYISTLAQAQKLVSTSSLERTVAFAGNLNAVDPTVIDNLDLDTILDIYADANGTPAKAMRPKDKVAQIRKQRQAAQAKAQAQQDAMAAVQGAQVLSKTPVGQNSALDAVIGQ